METDLGQRLEIAILEEGKDFAVLEEEWHDLYQNSPHATPFQSWAWLYSWWESYGEDYELRLVVIRADGVLVGLLPMMLERNRGFRKLLFVGTGITDYNDVLVRRGWEAPVTETGRRVLEQMGDWRVIELQELRPAAAAWELFRGWEGPKTSFWQSACPVIEVKSWDELLASLSRNHRSTVRRSLRRAEKDRIEYKLAKPADAEEAAIRWMTLHREAWRERNIAPEHLNEKFEACLVATVRRMSERGMGGVSEFQRNGEVIASQFLVFGRDFVGQHLFGATQDALRRYQVNSLYIRDALNVARVRRSLYLDMLRGEESYKLRWASRVVPNHRLVLGRDQLSLGLYTSYRSLRATARRYAESEDTPWWLRTVMNRLRQA